VDGLGRYYDPTTGQFLSIDPIVQQTLEAYLYAGDDPVGAVDPLGTTTMYAQGDSGYAQCGNPAIVTDTAWRICERLNEAGLVRAGRNILSAVSHIGNWLGTHLSRAARYANNNFGSFIQVLGAGLCVFTELTGCAVIAAVLVTAQLVHGGFTGQLTLTSGTETVSLGLADIASSALDRKSAQSQKGHWHPIQG